MVMGVPQLGQEVMVQKGGILINIGQVRSALIEEGGGSGFCVRTTKVDGEAYLKLHPSIEKTPLRWYD